MGIKCLKGEQYCFNGEPKEYLCDTDADFVNLPHCRTGSTAVSIETGNVLVVNTEGEWVPFAQ